MSAVHHAEFSGGCARLIRCRESAPEVAPAEKYELFLLSIEKHVAADSVRRSRKINGALLRRAIILLRSGQTMTEAGRAIGLAGSGALKRWIDRLPPELRA